MRFQAFLPLICYFLLNAFQENISMLRQKEIEIDECGLRFNLVYIYIGERERARVNLEVVSRPPEATTEKKENDQLQIGKD
ncbi:hypothetical protein K469DRAFT_712344 [Zopfia rhizophila CBS 207.26]|uniref:Uncharacterized protein n=1 Tax=Zopfia rhizophila CBS 207.26 TaxID=1314779 RepID=A0A6A6EN21_9PEZI|nr:hypothetical protein K469DRAFT_712344 [Zopfia rhizophila CBS 207.26]